MCYEFSAKTQNAFRVYVVVLARTYMCVIQPIPNLLDNKQLDKHQISIPAVILFLLRFKVKIPFLYTVKKGVFYCLSVRFHAEYFPLHNVITIINTSDSLVITMNP